MGEGGMGEVMEEGREEGEMEGWGRRGGVSHCE